MTGAAQGMRETHARLFGEDEALVVLADANSSDGERIAAELGPSANFIAHDVSDGSSWNAVVRGAEEALVRRHLVDNPAGRMARSQEVPKPLFLASDDATFVSGAEHLVDGDMISG